MVDITGTPNYPTYVAAKATFAGDKTIANGRDMGRQLSICIVEAGGNPGYLRSIPED